MGDRFLIWCLFYMHAPLISMYGEKNKCFRFGKLWNKDLVEMTALWFDLYLFSACDQATLMYLFHPVHLLFILSTFIRVPIHSWSYLSLSVHSQSDMLNGHSYNKVGRSMLLQAAVSLRSTNVHSLHQMIHYPLSTSTDKFWFFKSIFNID